MKQLFYFEGRRVEVARDPRIRSIRSTKAEQFLSCKHSVPLYRDDIMLTLQIVPGEIVPGRKILM